MADAAGVIWIEKMPRRWAKSGAVVGLIWSALILLSALLRDSYPRANYLPTRTYSPVKLTFTPPHFPLSSTSK